MIVYGLPNRLKLAADTFETVGGWFLVSKVRLMLFDYKRKILFWLKIYYPFTTNRIGRRWASSVLKDENETEISRTEPRRFLYLIRSNPYFLVRFYRFRFRISDVSYFKCKSRKRFRHFSTVFYFSTFNLKYSEFKIRFKPNLANCTGHTAQLLVATSNFNSYYPASY